MADRRQRRRQKLLFWGLVAALIGYGLFVGDHRPHHLALLYFQEQRTKAQAEDLAERNRALAAERERLARDAFALESLAREKGMIRRGDLVYRIVPVPPGVREAAAESLAARAALAAAESLAAAADSAAASP